MDIWAVQHARSEAFIQAAEQLQRQTADLYLHAAEAFIQAAEQSQRQAADLYLHAANAEASALEFCPPNTLTIGKTAVSAALLYLKADQRDQAILLASRWIGLGRLPEWAVTKLENLLKEDQSNG